MTEDERYDKIINVIIKEVSDMGLLCQQRRTSKPYTMPHICSNIVDSIAEKVADNKLPMWMAEITESEINEIIIELNERNEL